MTDGTPHISVLGDEAVSALNISRGGTYVDGTYGGGGYTARMVEAGARVIAVDRDPSAISAGEKRWKDYGERITFVNTPFDGIGEALPMLGVRHVDGVVFDFGVSSMHLDQSDRGFSFMGDGPLDMRMGSGRPASEFLNSAKVSDIADVIYQYGEERRARHLANIIVAARDEAPLQTTGQLADLAEKALGKGGKIHPATKLFQALRIFVNDELGQIVRVLQACEMLLTPGARLVTVAFHSLEDRIVKRFLAATSGRASGSRHEPEREAFPATFEVNGKPVEPSDVEISQNPRARSARMRVATRTAMAPSPWTQDRLAALGVPALVFSSLQKSWSVSP